MLFDKKCRTIRVVFSPKQNITAYTLALLIKSGLMFDHMHYYDETLHEFLAKTPPELYEHLEVYECSWIESPFFSVKSEYVEKKVYG
jgi:hypothetical protein